MEIHQSKTQKMCSLTGDLCQCEYRTRFNENTSWYFLSRLARNRVRH